MVLVAGFLTALSACGGGDDGGGGAAPTVEAPASGGNGGSSGGGTVTNRPPSIQGQAATSVAVGQAYVFQPIANDADGDRLTFSVTNLPSWATFDASTGRVSGTPADDDVGAYSGITITVSDGTASASLAAFGVAVTQVALGRATLSWLPPQQNTDGSVLQDLAGYEVLYGRAPDDLSQRVALSNPSLNSFVVENLSPGTWYFAVVAVNRSGVSSEPSGVASKVIS